MLTGGAAFSGETVSDTIAAILQREPDWAALPANVPSPVRTLITGCLAKERRKRIGDIAVARFVLEDSASATWWPAAVAPRRSRPRRVAVHASVWLLGVVMSGAAVWFATRTPKPLPRVTRFEITPPSASALTMSGFFNDLALTPDGTRLVYVGADGAALFVGRSISSMPRRSPGSTRRSDRSSRQTASGSACSTEPPPRSEESARSPAGRLVTLGRPDAPTRGASWGADGTIIFATTNATTGLQRIPAAGGEATVLTRPNRAAGEADHLWPEILPDGHSVLFTITALTGRLDQSQIALLDLRTGKQTVLIRGGSDARYVSSGHLVYAAEGTVRAVAFDLARLAVVGDSAAVLSQVRTTATGAANVAVAANGTLVYVPGGVAATESSSLVWVDRQGQETSLSAPPRSYVYPRLSPNGTRFAFFISDQELDIWLLDPSRSTLTRLVARCSNLCHFETK